jgi:hypothetical protein
MYLFGNFHLLFLCIFAYMKKHLKHFLLLAFILGMLSTTAYAQTNPYGKVRGDTLYSTGWSFGLNLGAFWANKYQAGFYNGQSGNMDSINLVFGNHYYLQDIKRELNDTFRLMELPTDMRYQPAMLIGFMGKYNMSHNLGIFIQFNYHSLRAKDVFTLALGPQVGYATWDSLLFCPIWGKEERMHIDLGISKDFVIDNGIHFFVEGGMNINYAKVKEHKIAIRSLEYSLINVYGNQAYIPNTQLQEYTVHMGGWGMGGFLNAGFRLIFNNQISIDPGASFYWSQVKLKGYTAFKPHFSAFVRICFQNLVTKDQFYN